MMSKSMNMATVWKDSKTINAATGLTLEEATSLLKDFEVTRISTKNHQKEKGGRPESLCFKEIFTMFMIYYRHYIQYEMIALMFEVSTTTAKRLIDESELLMRELLAKKNLSHLIALDQRMKSRNALQSKNPSILTALSNLYVDQKTT
jgi:hypothetical protein